MCIALQPDVSGARIADGREAIDHELHVVALSASQGRFSRAATKSKLVLLEEPESEWLQGKTSVAKLHDLYRR